MRTAIEGMLEELLKEYDIRRKGIKILDVPQGADNLNIPFCCEGGRFVLRCYKITPIDEIPFELEVISLLHRSGFPTPAAIETRTGAVLRDTCEGPAALFEFVDGRPIDARAPGSLEKAVALLADLHHQTQDVPLAAARKRSRSDIGRIRRLESVLHDTEGLAGEQGLREFMRLACETAEAYHKRAGGAGRQLHFGVIHHDFNPGNILVNQMDEVVALLDFDEAHESHLILDVAALLQYWCYDLDAGMNMEAAAEAVAHYHRHRPLTDAEKGSLREAVLLNLAADASDYLAGRVVGGDRDISVESCHSYQRFSRLRAAPDWEHRLLERL